MSHNNLILRLAWYSVIQYQGNERGHHFTLKPLQFVTISPYFIDGSKIYQHQKTMDAYGNTVVTTHYK